MIYLINTTYYNKETKEVIDLLKIGFTDNWNKRKTQYQLHNPLFKTIHLIENGTDEQESKLHYKFKEKNYDGYGDEWYYYDEEIINYIKSVTLEELDKLPNNPIRGDQRVLKGKREARFILSYLFNTKEDIDAYLANLSNILGDTISFNTSLDYIKSDLNINQGKLNHFLEIIKRKETNNYSDNVEINQEVIDFMDQYEKLTTAYDRLKFLCTSNISKEANDIILNLIPDSDKIKSYYISIGPDRLKELGYSVTLIKKELKIVTFDEGKLKEEIYNNFNVGDKLPLSDIKTKLQTIYTKVNYDKTPKAIDLNNYFETKESTMRTIIDGRKKTVRYYE